MRPVTPLGRVVELTVINSETYQRDFSWGRFSSEPTIFDENIPSMLQPPTRVVTTQNVTEVLPAVTFSFRFRTAAAPIADGLAAVPALAAPTAMVATKFQWWCLDRLNTAITPERLLSHGFNTGSSASSDSSLNPTDA